MAIIEELTSLNGLGMVLIAVSWVFQILPMLKGKKEIRMEFALLQVLGIILIAAGLTQAVTIVGILNVLSAIGAACVLVLLLKK